MRSPPRKLDILEVKYMPNPWKVLICCILLNRTKKTVAAPVIERLFEKYPTPEKLSRAKESSIEEIIRTLGLQKQRAKTLKVFSQQVVERGISEDTIDNLRGIGQYAKDAYNIFFHGSKRVHSRDYALRNFVRYSEEPFKKCPECHEVIEFHACTWKEGTFWKMFRKGFSQ